MKKILILIFIAGFLISCGGEVSSTGGNKNQSGNGSSSGGNSNNNNDDPCERPQADDGERPPALPSC